MEKITILVYVMILSQVINIKMNSEITEGMGYSSDSLMTAPTICYKPILTQRTKQTSEINFDNSYNFSKITEKFNISTNFSVGIGNFQIGALFSYLKEHEETSYSLSFNYYQKITGNVNMYYSYDAENLLNETGQKIYKNGENPLFRILCGDRLINSYEEGAALIFSLKLVFNDFSQKSDFQTQINIPLGSILNIGPQIKNLSEKHGFGGYLKISGFQLGGDPTQLSRIISLKTTTCSITNLEDCQDILKAMIDYASVEFPKQFESKEGKWTSSLVPLGQFTKDFSVDEFGIKLSDSFVDKSVLKSRDVLVEYFKKSEFYFNHLGFIYENYPAPLKKENRDILKEIFQKSKFNFDLIKTTSEPLFCWREPQKCQQIVDFIKDNYIEIKIPDFFKETFKEYFETSCHIKGKFWPIGDLKNLEKEKNYIKDEQTKNIKIMYQNLYENEKNDWFLINTNKEFNFIEKKNNTYEFNVEGEYHDNGDCPQNDNYIIMWFGHDNYSFRRHIHKIGKCKENWFEEPCDIVVKQNPFYFEDIYQREVLKETEI